MSVYVCVCVSVVVDCKLRESALGRSTVNLNISGNQITSFSSNTTAMIALCLFRLLDVSTNPIGGETDFLTSCSGYVNELVCRYAFSGDGIILI